MLKERDYLEREKELLNENKSLKTQINNLQKQNLKLKINFKEKGKGKQIRNTTLGKKRVSLLDMPKFRNFKMNLNKTKNNLKNEISTDIVNRSRKISEKDVVNRNRRTLYKKN